MPLRIGMGLGNFPFSSAGAYRDWGMLCEEGGIDSVWQSDRLVSTQPFLECMSSMAFLAGATRRLKFGMNVLSLGLRDPFLVARQCATIDYLSNGRLLPAFGVGSPASADWQSLGASSEGSGARVDEALEIITRLWRGESVNWQSPHFTYQGARISPLPAQKSLPLWIGGSSKAAIRRTGRIGTGWQAGLESPEEVAPVIRAIHLAASDAGRRIDPEHFGAGFFFRLDNPASPAAVASTQSLLKGAGRLQMDKAVIVGDADRIIAHLRAYEKAGVSKFILRPLGTDDADLMDQTARMIAEVFPAIHGQPATLPALPSH